MEADSLFTQEIIREFMLSHDGKVSNPTLIAHFKNFLNDPVRKVANRQQFKNYINNLATVKLDESGTKVLVLKKKFRETPGDTSELAAASAEPTHPPIVETVETRSKKEADDTNSIEQVTTEEVVTFKVEKGEDFEHSESIVNEATEDLVIQHQPASAEDAERTNCENEIFSDGSKDVSLIEQSLNLAKNYFMGSDEGKEEILLPVMNESTEPEETFVDAPKPSDAKDTKAIKMSDKEAVPGSTDRILRVKDAAMNIEKLETEKSSHLKVQQKTKRESRKPLGSDTNIDIESPSMTDADRKWMLASCRSDYQLMSKMLQTDPHLAPRRDFVTGFSALHWACKNGNSDVVKLLCGKYSVDANMRTSGGYTPMHLAAMAKQEDIMELLVKVYKADTTIRDYSGKLSKSYLGVSASNRTQHLVMPRKGGNFSILQFPLNRSPNQTMMSLGASTRDDKENSPKSSPISTRPFHPEDYSSLMPPPSKLPPVIRRRPTSMSSKSAHSDSEMATEGRPPLDNSSLMSGSTPNFETVV